MEKTKHYQLNQWAAGDKVQRIDFNADNAKIDAAIKAVDAKADTRASQTALDALLQRTAALEDKAALHTIKTVSYPQSKTGAAISLEDVDWARWRIVVTVIRAETDSASGTCRLFSWGGIRDSEPISDSKDFVFVQFPMCRSDLPFMGVLLSNNSTVFTFGTSLQTAKGFRLVPLSTQTLLRATATVYGMR